jgi:hypothetical protein
MPRQDIKIVAIEGDHVFGPSEAENMRLPFHEGWEMWAVICNDNVVVLSPKFPIVEETYRRLHVSSNAEV